MKEVVISYQILSGNLGEGWKDELETAKAYAELLKTAFYKKAKAEYPDAKTSIHIDVQYAVGCSRGIDAFGIDDEGDTIDLRDEFIDIPNKEWEEFCGSEIAISLSNEQ